MLVDAVSSKIRWAAEIVDRPTDLRYAGPCGATTVDEAGLAVKCTEDMYAPPGQPLAECRGCGATVPLDERRQWMLARVEDMLLPADLAAYAARGLGLEVSDSTIRVWASICQASQPRM